MIGFGSDWRFLPDYGIAIISFGNRTYSPMYQINSDLISFLIDSKIIEKKSIVSSTILQQRGNELIQLLTKNFDDSFLEKEILADNFYLDKPKRLRQNEYKIILEKIGNTISIVNEVVPMNNLRGTIRVQGGNGKQMKVFYTMTPENPPKIQALEISEINDTTQGS